MSEKLTDKANSLNDSMECKAWRLANSTVGKTVRLLLDSSQRARGVVVGCLPVECSALPGIKTKTVVFEITVQMTPKHAYKAKVRELPKPEVTEMVDIRVEGYEEDEEYAYEVAMFSPAYQGGMRVQGW